MSLKEKYPEVYENATPSRLKIIERIQKLKDIASANAKSNALKSPEERKAEADALTRRDFGHYLSIRRRDALAARLIERESKGNFLPIEQRERLNPGVRLKLILARRKSEQ